MINNVENISVLLKTIIDHNGKNYLQDQPYEVYKEILKSNYVDKNIAAAFLHLFLCTSSNDFDIPLDVEFYSKKIQEECFFKKEIADYLAKVMTLLNSKENTTEWKKNELIGLKEFLSENFLFPWECYAFWDGGNVEVECHYKASITLRPTSKIKNDEKLSMELKKNSFHTKEFIYNFFAYKLKQYLDHDFEEYCTADDYYPPATEDYCINIEYCLNEWCDKNGFELISCDGDGETSNYQSNSYRKYLR